MLLARLAVDRSCQGQGLGKALIKDALLRTAEAAEIAGIRALLVHARDDEARVWYEALEFEASPTTCSCSRRTCTPFCKPFRETGGNQHCVANKVPNSGRYRMLFETSKGRRRLFRPGDPCHPRRISGKDVPRDDEIPPAYRELVDWYRNEYAGGGGDGGGHEADPILSLRGLGKAIWADEDPDAYVDRLRERWG